MTIGPNELRQCRAVLRSDTDGDLRCQGEVTEQTAHPGDHWAFVGVPGNKICWTEAVANPDRTVVGSTRQTQVGGEHYAKHKIQPWDVWDEYDLDRYTANVIKYLLRGGDKPGNTRLQDLRKARHYLDKAIEMEEARDGG